MHKCQWCGEHASEDASCVCVACDALWCGPCGDTHVEEFVYDGEHRCTFCYPTVVLPLHESDMLDYLLEKHHTSRKRLRVEMMKRGPEQFRRALYKFRCTFCPKGQCPSSQCSYVGDSRGEEPDADDPEFTHDVKGLCCRAAGQDLCAACQAWEKRRMARTLIGLRKFRRTSVWALLPRDVLNHCIVPEVIKP